MSEPQDNEQTPTPRTDAEEQVQPQTGRKMVSGKFARELERELFIARGVRHNRDDMFKGSIRKRDAELASLKHRLAAAESERNEARAVLARLIAGVTLSDSAESERLRAERDDALHKAEVGVELNRTNYEAANRYMAENDKLRTQLSALRVLADGLAKALEDGRELAGTVVANAVIWPDPRMSGATDVYLVPMDDIEALSAYRAQP